MTHRFYRYPARFSPVFAAACIEAYSKPGQVVLDPYMGGGTTVVEAFIRGRIALGSDINALSVFIAEAKTTRLSASDRIALIEWAERIVGEMRCNVPPVQAVLDREPRNMHLPRARWLQKIISLCLISLPLHLPTTQAQTFARCVLLNVGQWALNGRKRTTSAAEFRNRIAYATREMIQGEAELSSAIDARGEDVRRPILRLNDADKIDLDETLIAKGLADLVVTSPPYPGVHMLYHRWQVDGRKETDAPYWIAACNDGCGAAYYNFAGRRGNSEDRYFEKAEGSFSAVRRVMRNGAILAQMVAFAQPERQLHRYLNAMGKAGFREMQQIDRIWRGVPGRRWHATTKGDLPSAREVVLLHVAD
jgi:DNA modification methylase